MPKVTTPSIKKKHDELFRRSMANSLVAQEFFDIHLPVEVKSLFNMDSLKFEKETFVDTHLDKTSSDVLFSAKLREQENDRKEMQETKETDNIAGNSQDKNQKPGTKKQTGYLYLLLEHQSKPDAKMTFRILKYMISIVDQHMLRHPEDKTLPLVYPMIFYSSAKAYNVPKNVWDLFSNPTLTKEFWTNDYRIINLHQIPDEKLQEKAWVGIMQFFMKYVYENNMITVWQKAISLLVQILQTDEERAYDYIKSTLAYTLTNLEEQNKIELQELLTTHLNAEEGEKVMASLAQKWFEEGAIKGKNEGIQIGETRGMEQKSIEIARRMLKEKLEPKFISEVTGLSLDKIRNLYND